MPVSADTALPCGPRQRAQLSASTGRTINKPSNDSHARALPQDDSARVLPRRYGNKNPPIGLFQGNTLDQAPERDPAYFRGE